MRFRGNVFGNNVPGIATRDGTSVFSNKDTLYFNPADFYLTRNTQGNPIVNLDDGFSGALLTLMDNTVLTSGVVEGPVNFTRSGVGTYDIGDWWNPASPTIITVPQGVSMVKLTARLNLLSNAVAPADSGYMTLALLKNGQSWLPSQRTRFMTLGSVSHITVMHAPPLPVKPGDQITYTVVAVFSNSFSILARNSYISIEKVS